MLSFSVGFVGNRVWGFLCFSPVTHTVEVAPEVGPEDGIGQGL